MVRKKMRSRKLRACLREATMPDDLEEVTHRLVHEVLKSLRFPGDGSDYRREAIYGAIRYEGPASVASLARQTHLSRRTVHRHLKELLEEGSVHLADDGRAEAGGSPQSQAKARAIYANASPELRALIDHASGAGWAKRPG